ncbi:MAG TPA: hypothetical protein DCS79_06170, partial [Gammaproteobacteria bacterium]|nr:hypothetical protein [Gammaproteobacteria bacterium]
MAPALQSGSNMMKQPLNARRFFALAAVCSSILLLSSCGDGESPTTVQSQSEQGEIVTDSRPPSPTVEDYRRAEQMLAPNMMPLLVDEIRAHYWQQDDRLIVRRRTEQGSDYVLVDPIAGSSVELFDSARVAALLKLQTGAEAADTAEKIDANDLNLRNLVLEANELRFDFSGDRFALNLDTILSSDAALTRLQAPPPHQFLSPDGERAAFIREHNLWVRSTRDESEVQLTFDGSADYGYATNSAGWIQDPGPVLLWSPDSSKIATFRQDSREVKTLTLVETAVGHPRVDT